MMAGSVGASVITPPFSLTSTSRCPVLPRKPDIGCDNARNLLSALSTSVARVMCTSTWSPRTARPVNGMRASRSTRSTSSSSACSRSLRTALVSTWRRRLEPPCRSRPSTIWRCAQLGQCWTTLSGKKFGTANRHTTSAVITIAAAFHRVKNNMDFEFPRYNARSTRAVVLRRLALGAHVAHHRAHLPHPHAVGDFDLDLVVVHDLGDLADETAIGNHGIAAAQRLDHLLMLLHLALLRAQDQEVHNHDDQNKRHERRDHAGRVAAAEQAAEGIALRECGRNEHCSSEGREGRQSGAPLPIWAALARKIARTIAAVGPIAMLQARFGKLASAPWPR